MTDGCSAKQCIFEVSSSQSSVNRCVSEVSQNCPEIIDESISEYEAIIHKEVARTTVSGLELLMLCLEAEIQRARACIREYGVKIRRFFHEDIHVNFRGLARRFIHLADRQCLYDIPDMNEDEAMILNVVPLRARWKPPKYTFNDIGLVLTTDEEVEDGVVHAYTIRSPAWSCLPPPLPASNSESVMGDFHLLNRPTKMSITADDDDERLSLPSTMVTDQELKIQSLEAQLSLLSKQMQLLLNGKRELATAVSGALDSPSPISDDEGKGASLCSPADTLRIHVPPQRQERSNIPQIRPPAGPPPPPPPSIASLFLSTAPTVKCVSTPTKRTVLQMLNKSADHEVLPVRPSVFDLSTVRLKKTDTVRSPGGTPVIRHPRLQPSADEGNYLAMALRKKFRSVQETLSEHEDDANTSWLDDDAD